MTDLSGLCDQVGTIFRNDLHINPPTIETNLIETGLLDSLAFIDLLVHLEKTFGLKITLENLEIDQFHSIATIAAFVAAQNGRREP